MRPTLPSPRHPPGNPPCPKCGRLLLTKGGLNAPYYCPTSRNHLGGYAPKPCGWTGTRESLERMNGVLKYRKLAVVIHAFQLREEICMALSRMARALPDEDPGLIIAILEGEIPPHSVTKGEMLPRPGDYIIKGYRGEL